MERAGRNRIMKTGVIVYVLLALLVSAQSTAVVAGGKGVKLPGGISHRELPNGQHEYVIQGIYVTKSLKDTLKYAPDYQKDEVPGCVSMEIDAQAETMKFVTEKKIGNLRELIDALAESGGCVPTWDELCMRGKRSAALEKDLYVVAFEKKLDFPGGLAVSSMEKLPEGGIKATCYSRSGDLKTNQAVYVVTYEDGTYTVSQSGKVERIEWPDHSVMSRKPEAEHAINYGKGDAGSLKFNPSTAYCMCHSRYAMRLFDETGEYVWENQDNVYGNHYPVVYDFQNDGIDEIVIFREDHSDESLLIFERKK
jgi:hypothetical protein